MYSKEKYVIVLEKSLKNTYKDSFLVKVEGQCSANLLITNLHERPLSKAFFEAFYQL